jgi:predicted nuclease of predicted toxin-antitoxin system
MNYSVDLKKFTSNQNTSIKHTKQYIQCVSEQDKSTPGIVYKNYIFPGNGKYKISVTGYSDKMNRTFVQILDPHNNRLINGYRYLKTVKDTIVVQFNITDSQNPHRIVILFGGTSVVEIGDQFYIHNINVTPTDTDEYHNAEHNQEVILTRNYDIDENFFTLPNPIEIVDTHLTNQNNHELTERLKIKDTNIVLILNNDGSVSWEKFHIKQKSTQTDY